MKFILIALVAVASIGSTATLADTPMTPAEQEKIKAALEALGCTADEIENEDEGSTFAYEVDNAKYKNGEYDIKLDKNFNVIIMLRD